MIHSLIKWPNKMQNLFPHNSGRLCTKNIEIKYHFLMRLVWSSTETSLKITVLSLRSRIKWDIWYPHTYSSAFIFHDTKNYSKPPHSNSVHHNFLINLKRLTRTFFNLDFFAEMIIYLFSFIFGIWHWLGFVVASCSSISIHEPARCVPSNPVTISI